MIKYEELIVKEVNFKMKQFSFLEKSEKTFWKDLTSGKFARMIKEKSKGQTLNGSKDVCNILKPIFAGDDDVERMYCIFLDTKDHILAIEKVSTGSLSSSAIYPREIVKRVIKLKAGAVVLSHNHPSRYTEPSNEDKLVTFKSYTGS